MDFCGIFIVKVYVTAALDLYVESSSTLQAVDISQVSRYQIMRKT